MKSYNSSIGYLKALGIMLMVLGHSGNSLHVNDFIYMFHMPLFFIASGYCFKEKYLSAPRQYLYNKVKGIYWPYVKWSLLFLLLHNVCFHLHLYSDQYGWKEYVSHLYTPHEFLHLAKCIVFKMNGHEQLLGGYWFMNALFFGSLIIIGIYGLPMERLAEFPVIIEYAKQGCWVAYFLVAMGVTCGVAYSEKYIRKVWR